MHGRSMHVLYNHMQKRLSHVVRGTSTHKLTLKLVEFLHEHKHKDLHCMWRQLVSSYLAIY
jgi:hypothetical protein